MLRNGEQLLADARAARARCSSALALTRVPDLGPGRRVDVAAPGVLALAVMSTAFTGQAIGTGFDRRYGVLRLLGTTPLGRGGLLAGRVAGGRSSSRSSRSSSLGALAARPRLAARRGRRARSRCSLLVLGTARSSALGLLLAGTPAREAVLAAANLVWVLLVAGGGVVVPPSTAGQARRGRALLPPARSATRCAPRSRAARSTLGGRRPACCSSGARRSRSRRALPSAGTDVAPQA